MQHTTAAFAALAIVVAVAAAQEACPSTFPEAGASATYVEDRTAANRLRESWLADTQAVEVTGFQSAIANDSCGYETSTQASNYENGTAVLGDGVVTATFSDLNDSDSVICLTSFYNENFIRRVEASVVFGANRRTRFTGGMRIEFNPPVRAASFTLLKHNNRPADFPSVDIECVNGDVLRVAEAPPVAVQTGGRLVSFVGEDDTETWCRSVHVNGADNADLFVVGELAVSVCASGDNSDSCATKTAAENDASAAVIGAGTCVELLWGCSA